MRMYQVRDKVARCMQGPIICEREDPAAVRMFYQACSDKNGQIGKYPADFEFLCLGEIDDTDGVILVDAEGLYPVSVASGAGFLAEASNAES